MNLTPHFTREEVEFSETAIRYGIDNSIPDEKLPTMINTLNNLEKIRTEISLVFNRELPIKITSGHRCLKVNRLIKSKDNSQHVICEATDTIAIGISVKTFYDVLKRLVNEKKIIVDQCILEYNRWVHISFVTRRANRNEFLVIG